MRASTVALRALLDSQQLLRANLFTFTLVNGTAYTWTDADIDVIANGITYSSTGPSISGAKYRLVRGLQVDTLDLRVLAKPSETIAGVPWSVAARSGALDGATVRIDKAFLASWTSPAESINIFTGNISECGSGEQDVTLKVVSDADRLNTKVPRLQFQPGCMRTLYDTGCGVSRAAFMATGSVTGSITRAAFGSNLGQPDAYYALGYLVFVSGANSGVRRSVKAYTHAGGRIELSYPLAFDLAIGDQFQVFAGCDKSRSTNGCAKFNNLDNFKGTPFIPAPEVMA